MYRGIEHRSALLVPPPLANSSCGAGRLVATAGAATGAVTGATPTSGTILGTIPAGVSISDLTQAIVILMLSIGILGANLLLILVINSRRYSKYIHEQPRYLLTSLASNDLAIGLLVTPFALLPSIYHCWPYGEIFCQIQALLRGALTQQSAVILICMAMDRYMCMLHPIRYHKHSSKKGCVAVISLTWILCLSSFALLVLPRGGYYFNSAGLLACDPFYSRASLRILASCAFYFPTTMILMYCYGSAFHVNKLRLKKAVCGQPQDVFNASTFNKLVVQERRLSTSASRTMAAMSLGFIVMVTPWTIQEVVAACTGSKLPPFLDFVITWLALSNSFWNPFLYWLLNHHFRRISKELFLTKVLCRRPVVQPPGPSKDHCCSSNRDSHSGLHGSCGYSCERSRERDRDRELERDDRDLDRDMDLDSRRDSDSSLDASLNGSLDASLNGSLAGSLAGLAVPPPPRPPATRPSHPPCHTSSHPDLESLNSKRPWTSNLERTLSATSLTGLPPRIIPPHSHLSHSFERHRHRHHHQLHHTHHHSSHHHYLHHSHRDNRDRTRSNHSVSSITPSRPNGSVPTEMRLFDDADRDVPPDDI